MKYIKKFENHSAYEAAESGLILPNVSLCVNEDELHYNPIVPLETRIIAKFNVTSTSSRTQIMAQYYASLFSSVEIDGVVQESVVTGYTFSTLGEHTVKYTLKNQTVIGGYAFQFCRNMTEVIIPNVVETIDGGAFNGCSGITSVTIGSGVTDIRTNVFNNCSGLTSVTILATTPPTLDSSALNNTNNCPIYVPSDSVNAYKSASGWSVYASRIDAIP